MTGFVAVRDRYGVHGLADAPMNEFFRLMCGVLADSLRFKGNRAAMPAICVHTETFGSAPSAHAAWIRNSLTLAVDRPGDNGPSRKLPVTKDGSGSLSDGRWTANSGRSQPKLGCPTVDVGSNIDETFAQQRATYGGMALATVGTMGVATAGRVGWSCTAWLVRQGV